MTSYEVIENYLTKNFKENLILKSYFFDKNNFLKLLFKSLPDLSRMPFATFDIVTNTPIKFALSQKPFMNEILVQLNIFSKDLLGEGRADKIALADVEEEILKIFNQEKVDYNTQILSADCNKVGSQVQEISGQNVYQQIFEITIKITKFNS